MNTDMNQCLIFRLCIGMLINYCKKNDCLKCLCWASSLAILLIEHISSWRASEASETLLVVVQWKTRYVYTYIYIYVRHVYMWYVRHVYM